MNETIVEVNNLTNVLGGNVIHDHLNLTFNRGDIIGIAGGSGCGKTTLLRAILMLLKPSFGSIKVFGTDVTICSAEHARRVRRRWGVLFQQNALFSSITVLENILFPMHEFAVCEPSIMEEIALLKLALAGLDTNVAHKYPAELSGGMQKRAALARAIALDPELLFLDEPTAGLDPQSAGAFDELVLHLQEALGLTIVIVTHDLDTLWRVTDKVAFLGNKIVLAYQPMAKLYQHPHPLIQQYFSGARSKRFEVEHHGV